MPEDFSVKVTKGTAWSVGGRLGVRAIGFVSTLILARLLVPDDFGIVALAMSTMAIFEALSDFRFGTALIHYQDATDDEYNSAWTLTVLRGILITLILLLTAPLLAAVLRDPRLIDVFRLIAFVPLINGFQNIGIINFQKDVAFDRDFKFQVLQKLLTFVVVVSLAFMFRSYWALLIGSISGQVIALAQSYIMHPYRPRFSLSSIKRIFGFSGWLMGNAFLQQVSMRLENFILGTLLGTSVTGLYHMAFEVATMVTQELIAPINRVLFPSFSKLAHDKERLREAYLKSSEIIVFLGTPIGIGFAMVAQEVVLIALGEKWLDTILPMQIISTFWAVILFATSSTSILPALGMTRTIFNIGLIVVIIQIPGTYYLIWEYGLLGAALSKSLFGFLWGIFFVIKVGKVINFRFVKLIGRYWRSYVAVMFMAIAVHLIAIPLTPYPISIILVGKIITGAIAYPATHLFLWNIAGRPTGAETYLFELYFNYRKKNLQGG